MVEDECLVREIVKEILEINGFEIFAADSGDEAIRLLDALDHVDIVVTDVRMPGRNDGVDVAHHARALFPRVPIIVAMGFADNIRDRLKPFSPAAVLLEKPYRLDRLTAFARQLCEPNKGGQV